MGDIFDQVSTSPQKSAPPVKGDIFDQVGAKESQAILSAPKGNGHEEDQPDSQSSASPTAHRGLITPGNIDLYNRPKIPNGGKMSTVYSGSFVDEKQGSPTFGKEVLVPYAADGKIYDEKGARERYYRTHEHLGVFEDPDSATAYAQQLHKDYEAGKYDQPAPPNVPLAASHKPTMFGSSRLATSHTPFSTPPGITRPVPAELSGAPEGSDQPFALDESGKTRTVPFGPRKGQPLTQTEAKSRENIVGAVMSPENIGNAMVPGAGSEIGAVQAAKKGEYTTAALKAVSGALEAPTMLMGPAAGEIAAAGKVLPALKFGAGLGAGFGASYGAGKGAEALNATPEQKALAETIGFFLPSVIGAGLGVRDISRENIPTGESASGVEALGGRVAVGKTETPNATTYGAKVGPFKAMRTVPKDVPAGPERQIEEPSNRIGMESPTASGGRPMPPSSGKPGANGMRVSVDQPPTIEAPTGPMTGHAPAPPSMVEEAAQAMANHNAQNHDILDTSAPPIQNRAPAPPPPPPPAPKYPEVNDANLKGVADVIKGLPPEQQGLAILEAHQHIANAALEQGKVFANGKIVVVEDEKQANKVATDLINEHVKLADSEQKDNKNDTSKPQVEDDLEAARRRPVPVEQVSPFLGVNQVPKESRASTKIAKSEAAQMGERILGHAESKKEAEKVAELVGQATSRRDVFDAASTGSESQQVAKAATSEPAKGETKYKYGNTQANIPAESEASKSLDAARARISDSDLAGDGKDVGDGGNHVTVRYGIKGDDTTAIKKYIESLTPFEAKLGKTASFPASEHSDGAAPLIAPIESPDLHKINDEIQKHGEFAKSSFPEYKPHATIAYVNPDKVKRYEGMDVTHGKKFTVNEIAISKRDGSQEIVKLKGAASPAQSPTSQPQIGLKLIHQGKELTISSVPKLGPIILKDQEGKSVRLDRKLVKDILKVDGESQIKQKLSNIEYIQANYPNLVQNFSPEERELLAQLPESASNKENHGPNPGAVEREVSQPPAGTAGKNESRLARPGQEREVQPSGTEGVVSGQNGTGEQEGAVGTSEYEALKKRVAELEAKKSGSANTGTKPAPLQAASLRVGAEALQKQIDAKRNPGVANQNPTARRARLADNSYRQAESIEQVQRKMIALADAIDAKQLPESLVGVKNRAQVETLLRHKDFPTAGVHRSLATTILEETKNVPGTKDARNKLGLAMGRDDYYIRLHGGEEVEALDFLVKKMQAKGKSTSSWNLDTDGYKRAVAMGLNTPDKWAQAHKDLMELGSKQPARDTRAEDLRKLERDDALNDNAPGSFPTPRPLSARLVKEADIQPGMSVLEPSAGKGNIADAVKDAVPDAKLDTIEPQTRKRDILALKGHNLVGNDFLTFEGGPYDRIVMNPPFERGADATHVEHAYELLKPGGRLVAIMGEGTFFRETQIERGFREWLDEVGGTSERLPAGSFTGKDSERQTGVASRMVVIDKPQELRKGATVTTVDGVTGKVVDVAGNQHGTNVDILTPDGEVKKVAAGEIVVKRVEPSEVAKPVERVSTAKEEAKPEIGTHVFTPEQLDGWEKEVRSQSYTAESKSGERKSFFDVLGKIPPDAAEELLPRFPANKDAALRTGLMSRAAQGQRSLEDRATTREGTVRIEPAKEVPKEGRNFEGRYVKAALEAAKADPPEAQQLFIKVPDDGKFVIPNTPEAIDRTIKATSKFGSATTTEKVSSGKLPNPTKEGRLAYIERLQAENRAGTGDKEANEQTIVEIQKLIAADEKGGSLKPGDKFSYTIPGKAMADGKGLPVAAFVTETPGLVVTKNSTTTPGRTRSSDYKITHESSGLAVIKDLDSSKEALAIAAALKNVGINWDVPTGDAVKKQWTKLPESTQSALRSAANSLLTVEDRIKAINSATLPVEAGNPGPGAKNAPVENETKTTSIQDLTDSIRRQAPEKSSIKNLLRKGGSIGQAAEAGKDALSQAFGRAKGVMAALWETYKNPRPSILLPRDGKDTSPYMKAVGEWDAADQWSAVDTRELRLAAEAAVPKLTKQEAVTVAIESGFDPAVMREWADVIKSNPEWKPYAKAFEAATALTPEELTIARNTANRNDSTAEEMIAADMIDEAYVNYMRHVWNNDSKVMGRVRAETNFSSLVTKPSITKGRVIPTYFEGITKLGMKPKNMSFAYLTAIHERSLREALAARSFIKSLTEAKASDERPVAITSWANAKEVSAEDVKGKEAYFIKPNIKVGDDYSDYKYIDHPALRGWRWAGDVDGKPIFVQGDMLVHPEIYRHLRNTLGRSAIRDYTVDVGGHEFRPGAAALDINAALKQTILSIVPARFHRTTLEAHALEHTTNPWNLKELDRNDPDQSLLVKSGLKIADYEGEEAFMEGLGQSSNLIKNIPYYGPWAQAASDSLFKTFLPKIKMTVGLKALSRNRQVYGTKFTDAKIAQITAKEMNAAFGGQNLRYLGRNKTTQDLLRLTLLAPDFLESRAKFVGQAARPQGREQLRAYLLGAVVMYLGFRIINEILDANPHWSKPFTAVFHGREYEWRSVQGDTVSAVTGPGDFALNRVSPVIGAIVKQEKFKPPKDETKVEMAKRIASKNAPIPLQPWLRNDRRHTDSNAQKAFETLLKWFGVNTRREQKEKK